MRNKNKWQTKNEHFFKKRKNRTQNLKFHVD